MKGGGMSVYVCVAMFISKRCSITQSNWTCALTPTMASHGGSVSKREIYCRGKGKDSQPQTNTYTGRQRHTQKGFMPNLATERQIGRSPRATEREGQREWEREREKEGWRGDRRRENTWWKMRLPRRQASNDTTQSQRSRALGIYREFWVMQPDMPQLSGPLTGCSDWAHELTGGMGHDERCWLAAVFLEAACEIAAYVGLSSV